MIKVFTDGYGGDRLTKSAHVTCNDPARRQFDLTVTGTVENFADIEPTSARLFGKTGEAIHATVRIIPEKKHFFEILSPSHRETNQFSYTVSRIDEPGTDGYLLTVKNKQQKPGRYFGHIVLKTDSPIRPEIKISVNGLIRE